MKTICVMRDVFKAMARFEDAFEKVYQVSLNEAMILCALQEASPNNMTATSLSKRTELTPSHASKTVSYTHLCFIVSRFIGTPIKVIRKQLPVFIVQFQLDEMHRSQIRWLLFSTI